MKLLVKNANTMLKRNVGEDTPDQLEVGMSVYQEIAEDIAKMLADKNESYGSSYVKVGDLMRILFPRGIPTDRLQEALVITRVLDKLGRLANSPDAFGESPWRDIAGYAILQLAFWQEKCHAFTSPRHSTLPKIQLTQMEFSNEPPYPPLQSASPIQEAVKQNDNVPDLTINLTKP